MNLQRFVYLTTFGLLITLSIRGFAGVTVDGVPDSGVRISTHGVPSSEQLQPPIPTPPTFIDESHAWVTGENELRIWCPDPNSDGLDPSGQARFQYVVRILRGCEEYYGTTISKSDYPYIFSLPFEIPFDDYLISIARRVGIGKKRTTSSGTVIIGPTSGSSSSTISSNFVEIDRWLLHVPRKSGGFTGTVAFNNRFPELPARVWVAGFDPNGNIIEGTQTPLVVVGEKPEIDIYGSPDAGDGLFRRDLQDQVSHIGIFEENKSRLLDLSITYQNVSEGSLTATVDETDLASGESVGSQFILEARGSADYWDGVAILNLTQIQSSNVQAVFKRLSDHEELARIDLGQVAPGEKALVVLSDLFEFRKDTYYTLETNNTEQKVQVLGLRGSSTGESPLLVGSGVFKTQ